jgi:hypothetical protein
MNWKFIISWSLKFLLCIIVWDLSVWLTNSIGLAFFMALGLLILISIAEFYIKEWINSKSSKL